VDIGLEFSVDRVIGQKVRQGFGISQVIDGRNLNGRIIETGPEEIPADSSESVNGNSHGHKFYYLKEKRCIKIINEAG
jgi:hypothetical protein